MILMINIESRNVYRSHYKNSDINRLKAQFHPSFYAVVCFCFEIALLLNAATRMVNYFYRAFLKHNTQVVRKSRCVLVKLPGLCCRVKIYKYKLISSLKRINPFASLGLPKRTLHRVRSSHRVQEPCPWKLKLFLFPKRGHLPLTTPNYNKKMQRIWKTPVLLLKHHIVGGNHCILKFVILS